MTSRRRARLDPEDLFDLRLPRTPRLSPDGRCVVYVEERADAARDCYRHGLRLVEVGTGRERALAAGPGSDRSPAWTPDSRAVVFVSDRGGKPDLWRVDLGSGEPVRLTDLEGPASAPQVSPDGRRIAFLYTVPSARRRARAAHAPRYWSRTSLGDEPDGNGPGAGAWTHLWILDLAARRLRQLTFGASDDAQHAWSPDGKHVAFVSARRPPTDRRLANSDVFVVPAAGGRARRMTHRPGPKLAPVWSPDGRHLAFIAHTRFPDTVENLHVWVVPVRGGPARDLMRETDLMCDDRLLSDSRPIFEWGAPPPSWSADGKRLFFVASLAGETNLWEVPAAGGTPRARSFGRQAITDLTPSADGRRWAFLRQGATHPGDVCLAQAARGAAHNRAGGIVAHAEVRQLTRLNAALLSRKVLIAPQEFQIACRGHSVHGWMLRAAGTGRRPAVLMLHGEPYAMYGWAFCFELQMLAARGYHVFYANLRGSAGYGRDFMRSLVGKWGSIDYDDLRRVADWIETQSFVDSRRLAVAGDSYGGYLASWTIAHTRRFKCAISMGGISNWLSAYSSTNAGCEFHREAGSPPWENFDIYWRTSPLAHVASIQTPLLILHSEDDPRVPASQAEELFEALKALRRDAEIVRFAAAGDPARGGRPHDRLERLRRIADWLDRKL